MAQVPGSADQYFVETLLDVKEVETALKSNPEKFKKTRYYLVKWKDCSEDQNSWEPAKNIDRVLIKEFEAKIGEMEEIKEKNVHEKVTNKIKFELAGKSYVKLGLDYVWHVLFDRTYFWHLFTVQLIFEFILGVLMIKFVPYTEIDWKAYCQEVEGYLSGITDYSLLKGDTGPLVYPAGFVYVYSFLYYITESGTNILLAQYIFLGVYLVTLIFAMLIYSRLKNVPPYAIILLSLSRRIHSIYMLRLFNDGVAVCFMLAAIYFLLLRKLISANVLFSLAVSVKMNNLLFAPAWLLALFTITSFSKSLLLVVLCAVIQIVLATPFLISFPWQYIKGAFDFGRIFTHTWTVNWRFVPEPIFVSKQFSLSLLIFHVFFLIYFLNKFYAFGGGLVTFIKNSLFDVLNRKAFQHESLPDLIVLSLFVSNFVGIVFARSLHYQFYSWYYFSLPYLIWRIDYPILFNFPKLKFLIRIFLLALIELCWNIYPSTYWSSSLLHVCHASILVGIVNIKF